MEVGVPHRFQTCWMDATNDSGLQSDVIIVEGCRGLAHAARRDAYFCRSGSPLAARRPFLVVGLRLGCLNHALLTAEAIEARRPSSLPLGVGKLGGSGFRAPRGEHGHAWRAGYCRKLLRHISVFARNPVAREGGSERVSVRASRIGAALAHTWVILAPMETRIENSRPNCSLTAAGSQAFLWGYLSVFH